MLQFADVKSQQTYFVCTDPKNDVIYYTGGEKVTITTDEKAEIDILNITIYSMNTYIYFVGALKLGFQYYDYLIKIWWNSDTFHVGNEILGNYTTISFTGSLPINFETCLVDESGNIIVRGDDDNFYQCENNSLRYQTPYYSLIANINNPFDVFVRAEYKSHDWIYNDELHYSSSEKAPGFTFIFSLVTITIIYLNYRVYLKKKQK